MTENKVSMYLSEQERRQMLVTPPGYSIPTVKLFHRADSLVNDPLSDLFTVILPVLLLRPHHSNSDFYDVRCDYTRERILEANLGSRAYQGTTNCQVKYLENIVAQDGALRNETTLVSYDTAYPLPTHLLAVQHEDDPYAGQDDNGLALKFFPVNSPLFAIECAALPALPHHVPMITTPGSNEFTVPVIPLSLPSPGSFNILLEYLYCKRKDVLIQKLLLVQDPRENYDHYTTSFASNFSCSHLLNRIFFVHGFWKNVTVLGVFDDDLWDAIGIVWKLLLMNFSVSNGQPEIMEATRSSATSLQDTTPMETKPLAEETNQESMEDFFTFTREAQLLELKRQQNEMFERFSRLKPGDNI